MSSSPSAPPIAATPEPPYYAVVFTSVRTHADAHAQAYARAADEMTRLAREQPGFLGVESARDADGVGITVSYWASLEAIQAWRAHAEHRAVQRAGREGWYGAYALRVCRVERASQFEATAADSKAAQRP
jgi:heme-degrading monooxygenase HmoA